MLQADTQETETDEGHTAIDDLLLTAGSCQGLGGGSCNSENHANANAGSRKVTELTFRLEDILRRNKKKEWEGDKRID